MSASARICLGHVSGAKGLKGEVRIHAYTGRPRDIAAYGPVADESGNRSFAVTVIAETDGGVIARLSGIADRTAAEKLRGVKLYVPRDALPKLPAGEYYQSDLVGLAAQTADGAALGRVLAIDDYGAGAIFEVGENRPTAALWPARAVGTVDLGRGIVVFHRLDEIVADEKADRGAKPPPDENGGKT